MARARVLPAGRARLRARDQEAARILGQTAPARPGGRANDRAINRHGRPRMAPLRLDRWFRRHYPGLAHGRLEKLLRTGQVRVDGKRAKAGDRVAPGPGDPRSAAGRCRRHRRAAAPARRGRSDEAVAARRGDLSRRLGHRPRQAARACRAGRHRHRAPCRRAARRAALRQRRAAAPRAPARQGHQRACC